MTELKIVTGDLEQVVGVGPWGTYVYTGLTYTLHSNTGLWNHQQ